MKNTVGANEEVALMLKLKKIQNTGQFAIIYNIQVVSFLAAAKSKLD